MSSIETSDIIETVESAINVFKNQIIIKKTTSGSSSIKSSVIFGKTRKDVLVKDFDKDFFFHTLKNPFRPEKT